MVGQSPNRVIIIWEASSAVILPRSTFLPRYLHSFLRWIPRRCHALRMIFSGSAGLPAMKWAFRFFQICQHRIALRICQKRSGICHVSGRGDATKMCSGPKTISASLFDAASRSRCVPHCQQITEIEHDHKQCEVSSLMFKLHLVHQIAGSVTGSAGNRQCWVAITLYNNCHMKAFSEVPL